MVASERQHDDDMTVRASPNVVMLMPETAIVRAGARVTVATGLQAHDCGELETGGCSLELGMCVQLP